MNTLRNNTIFAKVDKSIIYINQFIFTYEKQSTKRLDGIHCNTIYKYDIFARCVGRSY